MTPSVSLVIATTHRWPELEMTLSSVWPQVREMGAELILMDGDGRGLPSDWSGRWPGAVAVVAPGLSVFALRGRGLERARGEIVAITEDHCRLPAGWLRALVGAHGRHPEAAVVGGAVENGSTRRWIDRANAFLAHAPFMPPIENGPVRRISCQAGMSFTRRALPREVPPEGIMEMLYLDDLRRRGDALVACGDIVVQHVQSHGFLNTFAVHYHNGRSIAGFRRARMGVQHRVAYLLSRVALPAYLTLRPVLAVLGKRRRRAELAACLPLVAGLAVCHTVGEIVGIVAGAGESPRKLS